MTTRTTPEYLLEGLLACGTCRQPMAVGDDREARYYCRDMCGGLELRAAATDEAIIGEVIRTVLTDSNTRELLDAANETLDEETEGQLYMTSQNVEDMKAKPELLIQATGGARELRDFLGRFITEIQVHADGIVVRYSIPLPDDSPFAGMKEQEIGFPKEALG